MPGVESALAGVQERDKWLHRLEILEASLKEVLEKRRKLELKLRRVSEELQKLERTSREFVEVHERTAIPGVAGVPRGPIFR